MVSTGQGLSYGPSSGMLSERQDAYLSGSSVHSASIQQVRCAV
jgi:hypothetical protein